MIKMGTAEAVVQQPLPAQRGVHRRPHARLWRQHAQRHPVVTGRKFNGTDLFRSIQLFLIGFIEVNFNQKDN